jgi:hypothetical protein
VLLAVAEGLDTQEALGDTPGLDQETAP